MQVAQSFLPILNGKGKSSVVDDNARAEAWLTTQIRRGTVERFTDDLVVTPAMAKAMLVRNIGNRPVSVSRVAENAARLRNGSFKLTHQGIAMSKEGILNDGQHRLMAIAETGIAGALQVSFGCERAEFGIVDQGKKRTAGDILSIHGLTHANLRAALAGYILMIDRADASHVPSQEVADYALSIDSDLIQASCVVGSALATISSPTAMALAHYWIASKSAKPDMLPKFLENLASGENLAGVRHRLREYLIRGDVATSNSRSMTMKKTAATIKAWNAWRAGNKTVSFAWDHYITLPDVK